MISLQFSTENDPLSAMIRAFDHCLFSHVDMVMADGQLLGARSVGGVAIRPPSYAQFSKVLRVDLPTSPEQNAIATGFLRSQLGKPYDMLAIGAFVLNRSWRDTEAWFCSELACAALEVAKVFPHRIYNSANRITPGDLLLLCSTLTDIS